MTIEDMKKKSRTEKIIEGNIICTVDGFLLVWSVNPGEIAATILIMNASFKI